MAISRVIPTSKSIQTSGQYSTFYVGDLFFGVDVLHVQEVLRAQQMSPVPQAPDVIEGLINLRGQIVTAIDMRRRLQLDPRTGEENPMNIVVRTSDGVVSLLVDEIGDVLDMDSATYESTPESVDPDARELILGVYKLSDRLLLVLDTEKAADVSKAPATDIERSNTPYSPGTMRRKRIVPHATDLAAAAQSESDSKQIVNKKTSKRSAAGRNTRAVTTSKEQRQ